MKKIGSAIYVHWTNHRELKREHKDMISKAYKICNIGFECSDIYKIDMKNKKVSFIESKDFDILREPTVGRSYVVDIKNSTYKVIEPRGQIYHHKWMFVSDNYDGFDIEESKRWSEKWQSVIPKDRKIKSRIGYKKYWDEYLKQYNLEVE